MSAKTWTVIRFTRDIELPRFGVFEHETWLSSREVGDVLELGDWTVERGRDFEVVYSGPSHRDASRHERKLIRRCLHHGCQGCSVCEVVRLRLEPAPAGTVCSECGCLADGLRHGTLGPACRSCEAERLAMLAILLDSQGPEEFEEPEPGQQELFET